MFQARHGITLLDMVVTITILGIVAAVGAPKFTQSYNARRAQAAAALIKSDLNYLRGQAIARSRTIDVTVSSAARTLSCSDAPAMNGSEGSFFRELDDFVPRVVIVSDFDSTETIQFDLRGRPAASGDVLVAGSVNVVCGQASWQVQVNPVTGIATADRLN